MKSKKVTYLLIGCAVVLWGLIFYKIIRSLNKNTQEQIILSPYKRRNVTPISEVSDSFHLLLNYRDPFLGKAFKEREGKPSTKGASVFRPKITKDTIDWNFFSYNGSVNNRDKKNKVALVTVAGRDMLMKEGEKHDELVLLKNFGDSVKIAYKGKTHIYTLPVKK